MTNLINRYKVDLNTQGTQSIIQSVSIGSMTPENALDSLRSHGIECYVTAEGDLMVKYWHTIEDFVSPEKAAILRTTQPVPDQVDRLEWLSSNLEDIRREHGGQWIVIYNNEVVASAATLSDLMNRITEFEKPFITFIPVEPVVWDFTYAFKKF